MWHIFVTPFDMDLTNNNFNKNPDRENPMKSLSFTNGSLYNNHQHQTPPQAQPQPPPDMVVYSYKECLKNHAASLGGHALDGCGEFMPSPNADSTDPSSLKCAACGCHRNFHRRDPPSSFAALQWSTSPSTSPSTNPISPDPTSPPQPQQQQQPLAAASPTPCSYYSSAPHMLLALSTGYSRPSDDHYSIPRSGNLNQVVLIKREKLENPSGGRKRSRTKFSQEQKEKMCVFAEKIGWRLNKGEEKLVENFCNEVGLSRRVFKVWMHNNKHTFFKKDFNNNNQIQNINNDEDDDEDEEDEGINGYTINASAKSDQD